MCGEARVSCRSRESRGSAVTVAVVRIALLLWFSCLALRAGPAVADDAAVSVPDRHRQGPVPSWVDWMALPEPPEAASGGDRVSLLSDDQISLLGGQSHRFYRRASWVAGASGVANAGDFSIDFDPAFAQVTVHGIWVERDGKRSDRLATARIDTLRRESGLESGLLDGQLTLHLVIDDIRVGDIVDFAVSVSGDNPALDGIFRQHYWFATDIPTTLRQVRVLRPRARELAVKVGGEGIAHRRVELDGRIDDRWTLHDFAPVAGEDRVPPWHFSGPELEIADPVSWSEVVAWALPLYAQTDTGAIADLAKELGLRPGQADAEGVREAIRFVQEEVRYTGLELGAHAYRPYPPGTVLQRRYGDCKDKATLLVELLRYLGLQAHPAFVDVDDRARIAERLPGPQVFDHVIVRFEFEGREHWVDATSTSQRGALEHRVAPPYRRALLVAAGETAPREIPPTRLSQPRIDIRETIDLRNADGGLAEDADYRITTIYRGSSAENQRRAFANDSVEEVGQGYVESVAIYYANARQASPPVVRDDTEANEVTVEEHYVLPAVWVERADGASGTQADFWLSEIDRAMTRPKAIDRRNPWHLGEPNDVRQRLEILHDPGWKRERFKHSIRNPHFSYDGDVENDGKRFVMEGRLRTHSIEVPADDVAQLRRDMVQLSDDVSYSLLRGDRSAPATPDFSTWFDLRTLALGLVALLFWGWVAYCGVTPSLAAGIGVWFRPRASVRQGIEARRHVLAFVLLGLGGAVSALLDDGWLGAWAEGRFGYAAFVAALIVGGTIVVGAVSAALYAWVGRRFGGSGRSDDLLVVTGFAQVPSISVLPVILLALILFGPELVTAPEGAGVVALVLLAAGVLVPMALWSLVVWVAGIAEAHRIGIGRALLVAFVPLLALMLLVVLGVLLLQ